MPESAIKMVEKKVLSKVNKKFSKTQQVEKCILDDGYMDQYYMAFGNFVGSILTVLFIIPALCSWA